MPTGMYKNDPQSGGKSQGAKLGYGLLVSAIAMVGAHPGHAQKSIAGVYLCTVAEKAGIGSIHSDDAGGHSAFVDDRQPTRFKMRITPKPKGAKRYRLIEIAYDGSDRDTMETEDANSVLHSVYLGDGNVFNATDGPAFLTFGETGFPNSDGNFVFYHAGFEHPGGVDTNLAVRWGRCRRV